MAFGKKYPQRTKYVQIPAGGQSRVHRQEMTALLLQCYVILLTVVTQQRTNIVA